MRYIGGGSRLIGALWLGISTAGCQGHADAAQTPATAQAPLPVQTGTAVGDGMTTVTLRDPSLGDMPASQIVVPAGWSTTGQMAVSPCMNDPFASWHAAAPDGRSQLDVLPAVAWRWGGGGQRGMGCIPLSGVLPAADFLRQFAARLPDLHIIGPLPVADKYRAREENFTAQARLSSANLPHDLQFRATGDVAALRAVEANGNEVRLRGWVQCQDTARGGSCFAKVDILTAPKGGLDALVALVDTRNLVQDHPRQDWFAASTGRLRNSLAQDGAQRLKEGQEIAAANQKMLRDQYLSSSAQLDARHRAGMEELQNSTNSSMRNANDRMNARTTAASDYRDYAADQQTVSGANGTYKTSSRFTSVWSSPVGRPLSDGRTMGTTDDTLDPNTATDNTWTRDTKVHGNGQPR